MALRRLGCTDVYLSSVGFGTCQLRLVPEAQAMETLCRGFELGVNWVHVSPDYSGAEELVARAIRETGLKVIPVSDASGLMPHFEHLFEKTCRIFDTDYLDVWGISCIDDQEFVGHDVWGPKGMVAFLQNKKRQGRIGAVYCTTHGPPDYVADLITSGCFDAVMLAYNPLGFHVLSSYAASEGKLHENMVENRKRIFRLAHEKGVGILIMKPLAGGLLSRSLAFPPHGPCCKERGAITSTDILHHILGEEGITAVVPGTACIEEAEENARAGYLPLELPPDRRRILEERVAVLRTHMCSRCGECEPTCSLGLPISWLFRDAYIWMNPADSFEAIDRLLYFFLLPDEKPVCEGCENRTCRCPQGLNIPTELVRLNAKMIDLRQRGLLPSTSVKRATVGETLRAHIVFAGLPENLNPGVKGICRFWLENVGIEIWKQGNNPLDGVFVRARHGETVLAEASLREDVHPGRRGFASLAFSAPARIIPQRITFTLEKGKTRTVLVEHPYCTCGHQSPCMIKTTHGVRHVDHNLPDCVPPGEVFPVRLILENTGTLVWYATSPVGDHFGLAVLWDGQVIANHPLPRAQVAPGERVTLHFAVDAPLEPGIHRLELKMVQYKVTLFENSGSPALVVEINVEDKPPTRGAELWAKLQRYDPWQHLPTRGIVHSNSGESYPVIIERATGYTLTDVTGREYVDWTMGWGAVLLGHAYPHVQSAIREALESGPLVCLPRADELEVAQMLVEDFPGSEMACFGKNGSDACTFAARMARVFTGRRTILYSGYHGWQDFWVEQIGFASTGVPPREPSLIHRFPASDLEAFERLVEIHRDDLAAVFLEPSPWAGEKIGFEPEPESSTLITIAERTRAAGALFVMDEILTGYRYPERGVQQAKGVTPDLTCLGKSIASGMPLSAVIGRADVFKESLPRTFYAATFHAEAYSFAASRAAIDVYRNEPVARHVWEIGERLRTGIEERCRALCVKAHVSGPSYRMSFVFEDANLERERLARTLLHQELLRGGVYTLVGVMLPSYAHDKHALELTLAAFDRALHAISRAYAEDKWDQLIEIPPVPNH